MIIEKDEDHVEDEVVVENDNEDLQEEETLEESEVSKEDEPETDQDEEDDRIVTIGDAEPEEEEEAPQDSGLVKHLRKSFREKDKEARRLKKQLEEMQGAQSNKPVELGPKPTLASCDYDDNKYEQELLGYYNRKRQVEAQQEQAKKIVEEQNKAWAEKANQYVELKKTHKFKDFDESESIVESTLDQTQQSIIVQGAKDSALMVYTLGRYPKELERLSKIKNPVNFAVEIGKLEAQLKVTKRKAPKPEKRVSGGNVSGLGGNSDSTLERLREKAAKTGDYTEVTAYKRKMRNKG